MILSLKTTRNSKELKSKKDSKDNNGRVVKGKNVVTNSEKIRAKSNNSFNNNEHNLKTSMDQVEFKENRNLNINIKNSDQNLGEIKTESNANVFSKISNISSKNLIRDQKQIKTQISKDINIGIINKNIAGNIKTERNNANKLQKTQKENEKKDNKFKDDKILKSIDLDKNYEDEIGSNTIKSMHNAVVETNKTIKGVSGAIKTISHIPKNYRETKYKIKRIPYEIKNSVNEVKKTSGSIKQKSKIIYDDIRKGNLLGALNEIPIKKIKKASVNGLSKAFINTGKISKGLTVNSTKKFGSDLKKTAIKSKIDETTDLGSDTVFALGTIAKNGTKVLKTGIKKEVQGYDKLKTAKQKSLTYTKNGRIKTIRNNKIDFRVKSQFNKFKSSKVAKDEIKKYINKLKMKVAESIKYIASSIAKNPYVLGAIGIILVIFLVFSIILNTILGFHATYFISLEPEQPQWISSMNRLDEDIKRRVDEHERVRTIRHSGTKADWRDVIIAYYIKNNNSASLSGGGMTSLGGGTTSVDPDTWKKVFEELKSYLGTDYVYGGSSPSTGFDCSGLVQYCYGKYGISLPRTTYQQVLCGSHIEYDDMKAGDLVFFGTSDDVHHVGVYIGNGEYLHAPQTGDVVKVSDITSRTDFYEARRVFEVKEANDDSSSEDGESSKNEKILYTALPNKKDLVDIFYKVESETGVDAVLLASIAMTESGLNPNAVSGAGASGLCQLMPQTFKQIGFDESMIFDPYTNVKACAYYVSDLYNYSYIDSVEDMLTAYNGGPGNFKKYNGAIPGNAENQQYSGKVLNFYSQLSNGEQPSAMQGGVFINGSVNVTLSEVYKCFIEFYRDDNDKGKHKKWILRIYTVEEALENLGFNEDEKEQFYYFKDYNDKFDEDEQFKDYNVNFKFKVK
ncbi:peptidoglycan DL-endopeptidase CwlO [Clostridium neonatale]|nr:peptidoglycan DL-endopeptidase CwlO [Clostridium neonatale]